MKIKWFSVTIWIFIQFSHSTVSENFPFSPNNSTPFTQIIINKIVNFHRNQLSIHNFIPSLAARQPICMRAKTHHAIFQVLILVFRKRINSMIFVKYWLHLRHQQRSMTTRVCRRLTMEMEFIVVRCESRNIFEIRNPRINRHINFDVMKINKMTVIHANVLDCSVDTFLSSSFRFCYAFIFRSSLSRGSR